MTTTSSAHQEYEVPRTDQVWQSRKGSRCIIIVEVHADGATVDDLVDIANGSGGKDPTPRGQPRFMTATTLGRCYKPLK